MKIVSETLDIIGVDENANKYANVIRKIESIGRTCYSDDTEILTPNGWVFLKYLNEDDNIFTFDLKNNNLCIEKSNIIKKEYKGDVYKSNQIQIPFIVTPEHRMIGSKSHNRNYKFVVASKLIVNKNNNGYRLPKWFKKFKNTLNNDYNDVCLCEKDIKRGFLPSIKKKFEVNVNDDFLTIVCSYVTEGHIKEISGCGCNITITQTENTPLYKHLIKALKNLQWSYNITSDPRKPVIKFISINGGIPLKEWFKINCGKLSKNKKLPNWYTKLSTRQLEHVLKILYLGDGSHNTTRTEKYISISKILLDQVQTIWILLGKNGHVAYNPNKSQYNYVEECKRDSWILKPRHIVAQAYNGFVYCPSTNNGIVCVRRNGHAFWCGNCYKSEGKITDESAEEFCRKLIKRGHEAMIEHHSVSVRVVCDRGVLAEITRHRLASFAVESTRYVRSCEKFIDVVETEDDCINLYLEGYSMKRIANLSKDKYNEHDIYKILDKHEIEKRTKGKRGLINSNYFNIIDSVDKAYLLGFILGDGNIRGDNELTGKSNQISISQKESEEWYLLNMIRSFIQPKAKSLSFSDETIKKDLISKGIIPNKTYEMNEDHVNLLWSSVPNEYIYDFLRGFLDSDGSIRWFYQKETSKTQSCNICFNGNLFILRKIKSLLLEEFGYDIKIHDSDSKVMKRIFITDSKIGYSFCEKLYKNFKFPYGHSKTSNWYTAFDLELPIVNNEDDKFIVIKPPLSNKNLWTWGDAMFKSELSYGKLIALGETPQIARSVLPNSLKTEIVITANLREWRTIFKLRTPPTAHPQMRRIMNELLLAFQINLPVFFEDIKATKEV